MTTFRWLNFDTLKSFLGSKINLGFIEPYFSLVVF